MKTKHILFTALAVLHLTFAGYLCSYIWIEVVGTVGTDPVWWKPPTAVVFAAYLIASFATFVGVVNACWLDTPCESITDDIAELRAERDKLQAVLASARQSDQSVTCSSCGQSSFIPKAGVPLCPECEHQSDQKASQAEKKGKS